MPRALICEGNPDRYLSTKQNAALLYNPDGAPAARRIREQDPDVVLVFITNIAQYAVEGYSVGALPVGDRSDIRAKPTGFQRFYAEKPAYSGCTLVLL